MYRYCALLDNDDEDAYIPLPSEIPTDLAFVLSSTVCYCFSIDALFVNQKKIFFFFFQMYLSGDNDPEEVFVRVELNSTSQLLSDKPTLAVAKPCSTSFNNQRQSADNPSEIPMSALYIERVNAGGVSRFMQISVED